MMSVYHHAYTDVVSYQIHHHRFNISTLFPSFSPYLARHGSGDFGKEEVFLLSNYARIQLRRESLLIGLRVSLLKLNKEEEDAAPLCDAKHKKQ